MWTWDRQYYVHKSDMSPAAVYYKRKEKGRRERRTKWKDLQLKNAQQIQSKDLTLFFSGKFLKAEKIYSDVVR